MYKENIEWGKLKLIYLGALLECITWPPQMDPFIWTSFDCL